MWVRIIFVTLIVIIVDLAISPWIFAWYWNYTERDGALSAPIVKCIEFLPQLTAKYVDIYGEYWSWSYMKIHGKTD